MSKYSAFFSCIVFLFFGVVHAADAASLRVTPDTGVYTVGGTFAARVIINTAGQPVNAAEGSLSFNPRELSVVNVNRSGSIFNLWTQEPTFSNTAGTVTFGGGSPTGYTGNAGTIMSVTFRALNAGTPKVTFSSGSVLAADGLGTNVLTGMTGGTYTIGAAHVEPAAEPVYIPPANTPARPVVTSATHPDQDLWYQSKEASLSWSVPSDITAIRTLLDTNPGTIPTKVYDTPMSSITLNDIEEGESYFHIQFRNEDGWGGVTHFRLGVDSQPPSSFVISHPDEIDPANPEQRLIFNVEDISPVQRYLIQLDGGESIEYIDSDLTGEYMLPSLAPGRHTIIAEAFDSAGNSRIATYGFDVAAFDKPVFTEYPTRLNGEVIPVFKGQTRPDAEVTISIANTTGTMETSIVQSDEHGTFVFIPDTAFELGVYDISAVAKDQYGAQSDSSESIRIIVEEPGYIRVGSFVLSVLSVFVPLLALIVLLVFGLWYLWHRLLVWRRVVIRETKEAESRLAFEFNEITTNLASQVSKLKKSRKGKLTKAESALIDKLTTDIADAREKIQKEISDIDDVVQ